MKTFLVAIVIVNLWVSHIEGIPYYAMRRRDSGTAASMAEEPLSTRTLMQSLTKQRSESELLKRLEEDKRNFKLEGTDAGSMTKRESEAIKKEVEMRVQFEAEDILADATDGKGLRADEVKPAIDALRNSDELRQVAEEAVEIAARRMNVPLTHSRNGVEKVKRSQIVSQAVEEGVLRAVDDFRQTESSLSRLLTKEDTRSSFDDHKTDGSATKRESEVIKMAVEKAVRAEAGDILADATDGKTLRAEEVKPAIDVLRHSDELRQVAAEAAVIAARRMNVPLTHSRNGVEEVKRSQMVSQAVEDGVLRAVNDFRQTEPSLNRLLIKEDTRSSFDDHKTDGSATKRESEVIKKAVEKAVRAEAEDILADATDGKTLRAEEVKPAIDALRNSDELRQVAAEAAVIAARRMNVPLTHSRNDLEEVNRSQMVRQAVEEGVLRAVEGLQSSPSNRITISAIDKSLTLDRIQKAVMGAVMDITGRLGMMHKASRLNSKEAAAMVRTTANKPIVRYEAAKRAMEIAVDNGIIDEASTHRRYSYPQILRQVANLPSIRKIAAMGAVKKAVEMGVTA